MPVHLRHRPGTPVPHPARRRLPALVALALVAASAACGPPPSAGCAPGAPPPSVPATSPWAGTLCRQVSQKPPASVNGILYRDGVLWIASLSGGELVAADAVTGEIIGRFGPAQGLTTAPDDLAMAADGTIYWSGFATGEVGVLTPDGRSRQLARVGPGVNPVVLGADGAVYVGRFDTGAGLYRIDPATATVTVLNPDVRINAFGFGPDGAIYAPTMNVLPSRLLRIDPARWQATTLVPDIGLVASSVRFPPAARGEAPTTAYVLSELPARIQRLDVSTGRKIAPDIAVPLVIVDNMAFAPDGRVFVTAFVPAAVAVIALDGTSRTLAVGRA